MILRMMSNELKLVMVRAAHTAIYVVMAAASFVTLYAGITGARGLWLWLALALVAIESLVFVANGLRCPLTAVAAKYAGEEASISDTFFPERITRYTFSFFGPLITIALALLAARGIGLLN